MKQSKEAKILNYLLMGQFMAVSKSNTNFNVLLDLLQLLLIHDAIKRVNCLAL